MCKNCNQQENSVVKWRLILLKNHRHRILSVLSLKWQRSREHLKLQIKDSKTTSRHT